MQIINNIFRNTNKKKKYPLNNGGHFEPFFIVGAGRSGNTLIRRIIFQNPEVYIPPETYVLGKCVAQFRKHAGLEWDVICRNLLAMFALSQDADSFPTLYWRPLYLELLETADNKRSCDHIIDRWYMYLASKAKPSATRWGDKTPLNTFYLDKISALYPNAKYVHIVRDPYDVTASYVKMGRYENVEAAARRWLTAIDQCRNIEKQKPLQYLELRYETLVRDPEPQIKCLCDFLGIQFLPDMLSPPASVDAMGDIEAHSRYAEVKRPISPDSVGKGRQTLSQSDFERAERIVGARSAELGYA